MNGISICKALVTRNKIGSFLMVMVGEKSIPYDNIVLKQSGAGLTARNILLRIKHDLKKNHLS